MPRIDQNCPCTGKHMKHFAAPWILLTLVKHEGAHGYKIKKIMNTFTQDLGIPLNITGLYRHLDGLEKRGALYSQWDSRGKGPARRKYYLTESGKECLRYWMRTLSMQSLLIGRFFEQAKKIFPSIQMPSIRFESRTKSSDKQHPSKVSISKSNTNQRQEVAR
ncbi:MAG: helix-turn-helix transcriptional regulator [Desulfobacterales bacterium]